MGRGRPGHTLTVLLAALSVLLTWGCTSDADPEPLPDDERTEGEPDEEPVEDAGPRRGGTLRVGLVVDPVSIDPRFVVDDEGELLVDALFDPLVRVDDAGRVVAAAAERWEVLDDGASFVFHLREATFHDGTAVTADDFKRTFDRLADATAEPPSFLAYLLADVVGIDTAQELGGELEGVVVEDDRTLRIDLTSPQPAFLSTLSDPSLVPTPPLADQDLEAFANEPIGNGPFAMAGPREPGAFLRLVRFEEHHSPALLDEVLFTLYDLDEGEESQWSDLVDGQLQVAQLTPTRREEAVELFGRSADGYTGPGVLDGVRSPVYLYGFDTTQPPFDDARLRRAISLAIDRERLAEEATDGVRLPATSLVPPGIPGAQPGACGACEHDPDAARELLGEVVRELVGTEADGTDDDSGDDSGDEVEDAEVELPPAAEVIGPVTLTYNRGAFHGAIAEQLAAELAEVLELEVDFQGQELAPFIQGVRRGDVSVFRLGWDVTEPSPAAYLYPLFHSSQVGLDNLTRFEDAEVDELLDAARATDDDRERLGLLRDAERRIVDELPAIPLLWYQHDVVIRPEVQDLVYTPLGRFRLSEAWLDPDVEAP